MSETFSFAYDHPALGRLILQIAVDTSGCRIVLINGDSVSAVGAGVQSDGRQYTDLKSWSPLPNKTELLNVLNGDSGLRRELRNQLLNRANMYAKAAANVEDDR